MDNTSLQLAIKAIQDEARAPLEARLAEAVTAVQAFADHFGPLEDNHMLNDECRHCFALARAVLGASVSASAVQPERCCLDYPRCDCNSPPEPDDDWLCFQRPPQPKVTHER